HHRVIVEEARLAGFQTGFELQPLRRGAEGIDGVDFLRSELPFQLAESRIDYLADHEHADLAVSVGEDRDVIRRDGRGSRCFLTATMVRKAAIKYRHQIRPRGKDLIVHGEA